MEFAYYGRMASDTESFRKDKGVQYFMIDEHVTKIIDLRAERFNHDLTKTLKSFKQEVLGEIKELFKEITALKKHVYKDSKNDPKPAA